MDRRAALKSFAALGGAALAPAAVAQGDYPSRMIRLVSPYGAGGGNEITHGVLFAGGDDEILRKFLLQHEPLGADIIPRVPPVAQ